MKMRFDFTIAYKWYLHTSLLPVKRVRHSINKSRLWRLNTYISTQQNYSINHYAALTEIETTWWLKSDGAAIVVNGDRAANGLVV